MKERQHRLIRMHRGLTFNQMPKGLLAWRYVTRNISMSTNVALPANTYFHVQTTYRLPNTYQGQPPLHADA
jgi:hypothetical protein